MLKNTTVECYYDGMGITVNTNPALGNVTVRSTEEHKDRDVERFVPVSTIYPYSRLDCFCLSSISV